MNCNPHLLALVEDKTAQARTNLEHGEVERARDLLRQAQVYSEELQESLVPGGRPL
jgi:hypothetical protein